MSRIRVRLIALVAVILLAAIGCDALPRHPEFGPGPEIDFMVVGDSYTAGNGAIDGSQNFGYYFKSADDERPDEVVRQTDPNDSTGSRGCFRNHNAWGEQAYEDLRDTVANIGSFMNVACGGDTTENIVGVNAPPQLEGFSEAQRNEMDLIALTIGGNDLGFGSVVAACFATTLTGQLCDEKLRDAENMLEPIGSHYSIIQVEMLDALNKLKNEWPNAKIVLVGYPLFWEDETYTLEVCPGCGGSIEAGARLEEGLNDLNAQQAELVDDLNATSPGRFAFMPLHQENNQGFFDGHGIHGSESLWINPLEIISEHPEGRVHPNLDGHTAIAEQLVQLPLVQQAVNDAVQRDYPRMSLTNVDGQWYALDETDTLWEVGTDFVQCQQPDGPYGLVSWRKPEQVFDAAINSPPYSVLPDQPGCVLSIPREGDILEYLTDSHGYRYWRVSFGPNGERQRTEISRIQDDTAYWCMPRDGARIFNVTPEEAALYEDTGEAYSERETCGIVGVYEDPLGNIWVVNMMVDDEGFIQLEDPGTSAELVLGSQMEECIRSPELAHRFFGRMTHSFWSNEFQTIRRDYSGYTDARCVS